MSNNIVKYAFIAGELSPTLYGRSDLTKYDLGMAQAENWIVDYRGGLSNRPGFEFCEFVLSDNLETRFFPFEFDTSLSNTYGLLFGDHYIRFLQGGNYVLEQTNNVTSAGNTYTLAAHGYATGDWVKTNNGRTGVVTVLSPNTFSLVSYPDGAALPGMTTVARVYTKVSPYAASDLDGLYVNQYRDTVRITSTSFPSYDLIRNAATNWSLSKTPISPYTSGPIITSAVASSSGSAQVVFAVTAVFSDGSETPAGNYYLILNTVNYTTQVGSLKITWTPVVGARYYKVYRSIVGESPVDQGTQLGYAGKSFGTTFIDPNIAVDYSVAPPVITNPFAPGSIDSIDITSAGSGYDTFLTNINIADPTGTGFVGRVVVSNGGVTNVIIIDAGQNYTAPVASFTTGTRAAATVNINPDMGTYPAVSGVYQQRQIYAASIDKPLTVFGSQIKRFNNFNASDIASDSDAYQFDLDSASISGITSLAVVKGGMLLFTADSVWLMNGGASQPVISDTTVQAEPQTDVGSAGPVPISIEDDVLFVEGRGYYVQMLSYNPYSRNYDSTDKSILSNHLFGNDKQITRWTYQYSPFKIVWSVRSDGALLAFTTVKSEDVYAWTPCSTAGSFLDIINIREDNKDRIYVVTQRKVNGRLTKFVERMDNRDFLLSEDAWFVDCGLETVGTFQTQPVFLSPAPNDQVYLNAVSGTFDPSAVGKVVRAGFGVFKVKTFVSPTQLQMQVLVPAQEAYWPQDDSGISKEIDGWFLDPYITTISGLWHLEGETVSILGDGNVQPQQTVVNGQITLPNAVSKAIVGIPYSSVAQTLPITVSQSAIEGRRKRITELGVRLDNSRGLMVGRSLDPRDLYPFKERRDEAYGQPIKMFNGIAHQVISTNWDAEGQTYLVQNDPLPVTVLGLVSEIEVGDDPN